MIVLRLTVCGEGPNDSALVPLVVRLVKQYLPAVPVEGVFGDWRLYTPRPTTLAGKVVAAVELFPCDLLAVHRDADTSDRPKRVAEIVAAAADRGLTVPHVCVVPVRALEAWLLCDEPAIRRAAGNPNGKAKLDLPLPRQIERLADPKSRFRAALVAAGDPRRRRRQDVGSSAVYRLVAGEIEDFAPLRQLAAFVALEAEVEAFAAGWMAGHPADGAT